MDEAGDEDIKGKIETVLDILLHDAEALDSQEDSPTYVSDTLTRPVLEKQLYAFVQRYLITGDYVPEDMYKGQMTLIRGRQLQKGIRVAGDYYLSKVK